ncbi:carbohydrate ABC transporter membrane protein 2, CUT1 family [Tistlia consotensis]|uniref:Carbohydrate ABC transporter membrane protein 2, CUT1 family n=1 Tax=Tistlia consotensis USBA 355 TaxID=560819 RepID=A0A1Y6C167_9PROT|nr:carbohydrate ABC transporter permease [Tistlia consotensis]SMF38904.1 carbohydrate ABC transporter membrane protein 2, CUT1 family [Tistlia consotensis USBA 355]SNR36724.1 carbohydrate ABC transporter membrane protein 2, CUT1 family [Tistlia consotensis]
MSGRRALRLRRRLLRVAADLTTWALVLAVAFPLFWMLGTSLKPSAETFALPPTLIPAHVTFEHFRTLLFETPFPTYFLNSVIVATGTTLLVIVVSLLGAYSVVRFRYRGRRLAAQMVLFTYLLPAVVLLLPLYLILASLGLVNSLLGLILAYTTFAMPFSLWLLRSFILAMPIDLEEAAMVDGASRVEAFLDVVVPQALPGIISAALFSFILSWNEYLYALVFNRQDHTKTLPPGVITMLQQNTNTEWSLLMAASVMMAVPVIVAFVFLQRHLTSGFGAGAVKG